MTIRIPDRSLSSRISLIPSKLCIQIKQLQTRNLKSVVAVNSTVQLGIN